jgi:hypothetical protein
MASVLEAFTVYLAEHIKSGDMSTNDILDCISAINRYSRHGPGEFERAERELADSEEFKVTNRRHIARRRSAHDRRT